MEERRITVETDWEIQGMPLLRAHFHIRKKITAEQMECLRYGHVPMEMEDKWFWYMKDDTLYAHRSWTGCCIYILKFHKGRDVIDVTVNRDPGQYTCTSKKEDAENVSNLLSWWCQENYDYYHEWLEETLHALHPNQ